MGPKIWGILLVEIKQAEYLLEFKAKTKNYILQGCPCHLCKVYFQHVGFIQVNKQYENFESSVMAFFGTSEQIPANNIAQL